MRALKKSAAGRALDTLKTCSALEVAIVMRELTNLYHDKAIVDVLMSLEEEIRSSDPKNPAIRIIASRRRLFEPDELLDKPKKHG